MQYLPICMLNTPSSYEGHDQVKEWAETKKTFSGSVDEIMVIIMLKLNFIKAENDNIVSSVALVWWPLVLPVHAQLEHYKASGYHMVSTSSNAQFLPLRITTLLMIFS